MALTERTTRTIRVDDNGTVFEDVKTLVLKDSVFFADAGTHVNTIAPGDDYSTYDAKVQAVCGVMHTPDVIDTYAVILRAG